MSRVLGLAIEGNWTTTDFAFDVLSLQALFLVLSSLAIFNCRYPEHSAF